MKIKTYLSFNFDSSLHLPNRLAVPKTALNVTSENKHSMMATVELMFSECANGMQ